MKFVWTVALIKRIILAEKKYILNLSWKYPLVLKAPLNTQIKRTKADKEKAVGKKNIPIKNNLLNNNWLFLSFFSKLTSCKEFVLINSNNIYICNLKILFWTYIFRKVFKTIFLFTSRLVKIWFTIFLQFIFIFFEVLGNPL